MTFKILGFKQSLNHEYALLIYAMTLVQGQSFGFPLPFYMAMTYESVILFQDCFIVLALFFLPSNIIFSLIHNQVQTNCCILLLLLQLQTKNTWNPQAKTYNT